MEDRQDALRELDEALHEQDLAQARYEAAIGTSAEMGAYLRLRNASRRVARADRAAAQDALARA